MSITLCICIVTSMTPPIQKTGSVNVLASIPTCRRALDAASVNEPTLSARLGLTGAPPRLSGSGPDLA